MEKEHNNYVETIITALVERIHKLESEKDSLETDIILKDYEIRNLKAEVKSLKEKCESDTITDTGSTLGIFSDLPDIPDIVTTKANKEIAEGLEI